MSNRNEIPVVGAKQTIASASDFFGGVFGMVAGLAFIAALCFLLGLGYAGLWEVFEFAFPYAVEILLWALAALENVVGFLFDIVGILFDNLVVLIK